MKIFVEDEFNAMKQTNFAWHFAMLFESILQKWKKICLSYLKIYQFFLNSNFVLKFSATFCNATRKSHAKSEQKFLSQILIYYNFSCICVPNRVRCIKLSRHERVKGRSQVVDYFPDVFETVSFTFLFMGTQLKIMYTFPINKVLKSFHTSSETT